MKTIKLLSFFAFIFLLTSCDALSDLTQKTVEISAPAIDFSIGGALPAPQQKVKAGAAAEIIWYNESVDFGTTLTAKLNELGLKTSNIKAFGISASVLKLNTIITKNYDLGNITIYINDKLVATGSGFLTPTTNEIIFNFSQPYSLLDLVDLGTAQLKITSTAAKPDIQFDFSMLNKYTATIGFAWAQW